MWFCTDKGVARFDGYKFEKFTTKNGLPNNDVWHCAEDRNGRIWFLSYANAFFYFDLKDDKFHVINNPYKDNYDAHIWCYVQESKNLLRIILSDGNTIILDIPSNTLKRTKNTQYIRHYPIIVNKHFYYKSNNTTRWLLRAFSEGLKHNIAKKKHVLPPINYIKKLFWENAVTIIFDDDKTIYGNNDSIAYFKNNQFKSRNLSDLTYFKSDKLSLVLNAGNPNRKLVVTEKDLFIINENLERIKSLDFIKQLNPNTVFFDNSNNLWVCSKNNGMYFLSEKSINSKVIKRFSTQSITAIAYDCFERLWLGNNEGHIDIINKDESFANYNFIQKRIPVKQIMCTPRHIYILWFDTRLSIILNDKIIKSNYLFKETNFQKVKSILTNNSPRKIIRSFLKKGNSTTINALGAKTMIANTSNSIILGNYNTISLFEEKNTYYRNTFFGYKVIPSLKVLALKTLMKKDAIFVGTNKGLEIVNKYEQLQNIQSIKQKYPILTKPISCFESDDQNALWAGTDGYGVYRFVNNKVQLFPELQGMIINHLYFDKAKKYLFASTNEGIYVVIVKSYNQPIKYTVQKISLAQGLPTLEVNCTVTRGNDLFVGTSKGLAKLPIEEIVNAQSVPNITPLIIKNIKINRRDTTVSSFYNLTYQQNNIDFDFVALSYKSDKNIKYDYKLLSNNSNDTTWHPTEDLHKEFSLLPPGKYEFHLRAFDIEGIATQTIKPIVFVINPPFWQTLWFKLLIIFVILSAIILFFYLRTKNIQKKEQERTEINKKFAELELQALQAQMNPHFVFNALSAIQNFILNNNTEEATDYLSKFSRLMRLFLESSRNKYISLRDEKLLLEYYIQLEKLRFSGKFTYQFIIDRNVGLDTEIPSMLLQPFIENAINHGLIYKENNEGKLTITFTMEDQKLICEIDDNGIGRQKAAEIKNQSLKPYKSRGTEITEERLRSLELIENTKIEVMINDKIDENNVAKGTKVIIVVYL
jgi:ligand-binding sensor domain-containing protein